jgi:hypothetical protein
MFHALVMTHPSSHLILYVPGRRLNSSPSSGVFSIAGPHCIHPIDHVTNADYEALMCGIVVFDAGGVGVAKPVVCGIEEPNITGSGTLKKSHSSYPCEAEGGSSLSEPWYDSSSMAMSLLAARRWKPGISSHAATSVHADEV